MKYIILSIDGMPTPFLFPEHVSHETIARAVSNALTAENKERDVEQVSAGFAQFDGGVKVGGTSQSLGLSSRGPADAITIASAANMPSTGLNA